MHHQGPKQVPSPESQPPSPAAQRLPPDAESAKQSSVPLRALCGEAVDSWIPDSKLPALPKNSINSLIRKILLATPEFPRFYADFILALAPNSNETNILRPHYQKILAKVNAMSTDHSCTHIKVTGVRCNSPALREEQFCYFHQNAHRASGIIHPSKGTNVGHPSTPLLAPQRTSALKCSGPGEWVRRESASHRPREQWDPSAGNGSG